MDFFPEELKGSGRGLVPQRQRAAQTWNVQFSFHQVPPDTGPRKEEGRVPRDHLKGIWTALSGMQSPHHIHFWFTEAGVVIPICHRLGD